MTDISAIATWFPKAKEIFRTFESHTEDIAKHFAKHVQDSSSDKPKVDRVRLEEIQSDTFPFAKLLAQCEAVRVYLDYAENHCGSDQLEKGLALIYMAGWLRSLDQYRFGRTLASSSLRDDLESQAEFIREVESRDTIAPLSKAMQGRDRFAGGQYALSEDHQAIAEAFTRFASEQIAPLAEEIHRKDQLIPEKLLQGLCELGIFGISIPEEYGGNYIDHRSMIIATEELSMASLGAGGSVITRPEICAKAILSGGTEEQKQKWLPAIASGERMVCVAVTEPNAGSDVANVQVTAKPTEGGFLIQGEKTWCTFAGRADVFILLARTGGQGHRGLTLFLVEKPAYDSEMEPTKTNHEYAFEHTQEGGGKIVGHAIPTMGYRGMHSFAVSFEDYFVPAENQIGDSGQGFILQMKGFAGGRIQTAARAIGVMEAAFREGLRYATEREVFKKNLISLPLIQEKLVRMAATLQANRQLTYYIGDLMDEGKGDFEASLIKLLSCSDAEWITREAMQIHGGMGYSEEYPVSRYFCDARVLSIFEGAEEVLALMVIIRQKCQEILSQKMQ